MTVNLTRHPTFLLHEVATNIAAPLCASARTTTTQHLRDPEVPGSQPGLADVSSPFIFGAMYGEDGQRMLLSLAGVCLVKDCDGFRLTQPVLPMAGYMFHSLGTSVALAGFMYTTSSLSVCGSILVTSTDTDGDGVFFEHHCLSASSSSKRSLSYIELDFNGSGQLR